MCINTSIAVFNRQADEVPSKLQHQIPEHTATAVAGNKSCKALTTARGSAAVHGAASLENTRDSFLQLP